MKKQSPFVQQLAQLGSPCSFAAGDRVFKAGDLGDSMYLLVSGCIELRFPDDRPIKHLRAGEVFGELSLLFGAHRRTATAAAVEESELKMLDQRTFDAVKNTQPALLLEVLKDTCKNLLEAEQLLTHQLRNRNGELALVLERLSATESRLESAEIEALTDPLTGLFNRRALNLQIGRFLEGIQKQGGQVTLLLIDIDHFKAHNDAFGHSSGDRLLRRVAELLRANLRRSDLPYRIGGDEFAVLLFDIDPQDAKGRAIELHHALHALDDLEPSPMAATPEMQDKTRQRPTVSLGGAAFRESESWSTFFDRADKSLYLAKRKGRGRVAWEQTPVEPRGR